MTSPVLSAARSGPSARPGPAISEYKGGRSVGRWNYLAAIFTPAAVLRVLVLLGFRVILVVLAVILAFFVVIFADFMLEAKDDSAILDDNLGEKVHAERHLR